MIIKFNPSVLFFSLLILITGCNKGNNHLTAEYLDGLDAWKTERREEVVDEWLPLVGLKWLEEGRTAFGSDSLNKIIFPPAAPSILGSFYLRGDTVKMKIRDSLEIRVNNGIYASNDMPVDESMIFGFESIEWTVIKRAGKYAVRIWDRSGNEDSFSIDYFDPDPGWIVRGQFIPYTSGKTYPIANVIGLITETPIPGNLKFKVDGKEYSLDVMEGGEDTWFVIFGDETNGDQTYGAGRYMYVRRSNDGENPVIDFNRSYNPPCAFTEFATCPLPPAQNHLKLAVTAGEKIRDSFH